METIDYKQKIKDYMNSSEVDTLYKSMLNNLFPELKESEDEKIRKDIIVLVKDWWDRVNKDNISTKEQMISWLEKQGEQKPAWSEEDETGLTNTIIMLKEGASLHFNKKDITKAVDWLKSIRPQNNITDEELAQAKKDAYNDALNKIEYHSGEPTFDDGWSAAIWYLKKRNAQPQPTWKQSDEQMGVIEAVINNRSFQRRHLDSLYEQLKKLKED